MQERQPECKSRGNPIQPARDCLHQLRGGFFCETTWMATVRGSIRNEARYRQGYEHSGWAEILPNKITPSDIDVVFDFKSRARVLFCEFSSKESLWPEKATGQRMLYQQLLRTNNYGNACVLCRHAAPVEKPIDSINDVITFHVMRCKDGKDQYLPSEYVAFDGSRWVDFVRCFYGLENNFGEW